MKNLVLSLSIVSALFLAACGKKEEAAPAAPAATPPAPAQTTPAPGSAPADQSQPAQPTEQKPADQPKQ